MNNLALVVILGLVIFIIWMIKYLEKKLPERDKRIKDEYIKELKKTIEEENLELETKNVSSDNEKSINLHNTVKKHKNSLDRKQIYKDNIRKGRDYELYIVDYFRKQGYQIKPFGILNGKKDHGIDVIIKKNKEITLIQCKNWKQDSSYKIKHSHLKEFLGNTTAFLDNNKEKAEGYIIKRMYITSHDILDKSAKHFLKENSILEHRVIPYIN